jgi:cyclopropane fatty-acyl-phospholipid synthase-like methyltransferase
MKARETMLKRLQFWWRYFNDDIPWDTNQTPPEIVALIEDEQIAPGRALDIGCGTGTNVIYLAQHGWDAVGIDYVPHAIRAARRKAQQAGVSHQTQFRVADVARLDASALGDHFDLAMDIGCGHSLPAEARHAYARLLGEVIRPGGIFMLYMFRATDERPHGMRPDEVETLFAPLFRMRHVDLGQDTAADFASAWYRLERV